MEHKKNYIINDIPKNNFFEIDFSEINDEKVLEIINKPIILTEEEIAEGFYFEFPEEGWGWDEILTYVKYRSPTEEELKRNNKTIEDFKIGEFISKTNSHNDLIPIEDFKIENEAYKLSFICLKTLLKNKDFIFKSGNSIYI